jgi:hypothetical protein
VHEMLLQAQANLAETPASQQPASA